MRVYVLHCMCTLIPFIEQTDRVQILELFHPCRLLAGDTTVPPFSHPKLGINTALTSKVVVRIQ